MIFRTKPRSPSRRSPDGHGHHAPMYPRTAREMNRSQSALPEHGFLGLPATKSSVKSKRTTCDICRERKVRCNKEQPCERCVRLKLKCTYTPTPSSMNVSQTLMFLHERLGEFQSALDLFHSRSLADNCASSAGRGRPRRSQSRKCPLPTADIPERTPLYQPKTAEVSLE